MNLYFLQHWVMNQNKLDSLQAISRYKLSWKYAIFVNYLCCDLLFARLRSCIFICSWVIKWQWPVLYFCKIWIHLGGTMAFSRQTVISHLLYGFYLPIGEIRFVLRHKIFKTRKSFEFNKYRSCELSFFYSLCYLTEKQNGW